MCQVRTCMSDTSKCRCAKYVHVCPIRVSAGVPSTYMYVRYGDDRESVRLFDAPGIRSGVFGLKCGVLVEMTRQLRNSNF